jgi:hypothetical protein
MKKNAIIITLFIILSLIAFYVKENSMSKSNLELFISFQTGDIYTEYIKEIEKAEKENGEKTSGVKYIKENYEDKYGKNLVNLKSVVEKDTKKRIFIIYENKYFRQILYSSLFLFWLGVAFYLHRK